MREIAGGGGGGGGGGGPAAPTGFPRDGTSKEGGGGGGGGGGADEVETATCCLSWESIDVESSLGCGKSKAVEAGNGSSRFFSYTNTNKYFLWN